MENPETLVSIRYGSSHHGPESRLDGGIATNLTSPLVNLNAEENFNVSESHTTTNSTFSVTQALSASSFNRASPICELSSESNVFTTSSDARRAEISPTLTSITSIIRRLWSAPKNKPEPAQNQPVDCRLAGQLEGSVVVPIQAEDKVYLFRGAPGLYVAHEDQIPPPEQQMQQWDNHIQPRLWTDVCEFQKKMMRTKTGRRFPPTVSLELRMSGYTASHGSTHVQLLPRIWIRYDHDRWKKEVKKFVRDLEWLQEYSQLGPIEVRRGSPRLATLKPPLFVENLPLHPGHGFEVSNGAYLYLHAQRPVGPSAMGLLCCATLTKHGKICGQRISRMGGLITIDHCRTLSMTTAHGMIELAWDAALDDAIDGEEWEGNGLSPVDGYDSDDSIDPGDPWPTNPASFDPKMVQDWDPIETLGMSSFLGHADPDLRSHLAETWATETPVLREGTDFSLCGLPRAHVYHNIYQAPDSTDKFVELVPGDQTPTIENPAPNDLYILLGPNHIIKAHLVPGESQFMVRGVRFVGQKIRTPEPLGPGCSGSWVVRGASFLGMLIACNEYEPYAHFIPRKDLFANALSVIRGSKRIEVHTEPPAQQRAPAPQIETEMEKPGGQDHQHTLLHNVMEFISTGLSLNPSDPNSAGKSVASTVSGVGGQTVLDQIINEEASCKAWPTTRLNMTAANLHKAGQRLASVFPDPIENMASALGIWYSSAEDPLRARAFWRFKMHVADQYEHDAPWNLKAYLSITPEELEDGYALLQSMHRDLTNECSSLHKSRSTALPTTGSLDQPLNQPLDVPPLLTEEAGFTGRGKERQFQAVGPTRSAALSFRSPSKSGTRPPPECGKHSPHLQSTPLSNTCAHPGCGEHFSSCAKLNDHARNENHRAFRCHSGTTFTRSDALTQYAKNHTSEEIAQSSTVKDRLGYLAKTPHAQSSAFPPFETSSGSQVAKKSSYDELSADKVVVEDISYDIGKVNVFEHLTPTEFYIGRS